MLAYNRASHGVLSAKCRRTISSRLWNGGVTYRLQSLFKVSHMNAMSTRSYLVSHDKIKFCLYEMLQKNLHVFQDVIAYIFYLILFI